MAHSGRCTKPISIGGLQAHDQPVMKFNKYTDNTPPL